MINISFQQHVSSGASERAESHNIILNTVALTPQPSDYGTTATYVHDGLQSWGVKEIIITPYGIIAFVPSDPDLLTKLRESYDEQGGLTYTSIPRQSNIGVDRRIPYISPPDTNPLSAKLRKKFPHIAIATKKYLGVKITGPDDKRLTITF